MPTFVEPTPMTYESDLLWLEMQMPTNLELYHLNLRNLAINLILNTFSSHV